MTLVSPSQSAAGEVINAADINTPVNQLAAVINGAIDNTNIATGGVATANIADGAVTSAKLVAGAPVQMTSTTSSAVSTTTTVIPGDDTIPQNTEGAEFMTLAITPKSATNILVIEVVAVVGIGAANNAIGAIFQDSTADAVAAAFTRVPGNDNPAILTVRHTMAAGTTSATTFKFRAGPQAAGTLTFNGVAAGRVFGAITKSSIVITEYKA